MAITVYGVERNLDLTQWARVQEAQSKAAPMPAAVIQGGAVTLTGGLGFSIAAGKAVVPGCLVEWTTTTGTFTTAPNSRLDVLTLQVVWGDGSAGSSLTAGSFVVEKGAAGSGESGVGPTLTQTAGVKYQLPLKTYLVAGSTLDEQPGDWGYATTGWTAATPAGNWSRPSGVGLAVKRLTDDTVLANGQLKREEGAATIPVGTESSISGLRLIPVEFTPSREVNTYGMWDVYTGNPGWAYIRIDRGFGYITPLNKPLVAGNTIRIVDTTWETK